MLNNTAIQGNAFYSLNFDKINKMTVWTTIDDRLPNIKDQCSNFKRDNRQLMVVVLPLPFGPSKPNISPFFTSNDKLSKALNLP